MRAIKSLFAIFTILILITSCTDDFTLDYQIRGSSQLSGAPGQELMFTINFQGDIGVQQIILESNELGLDYVENIERPAGDITRSFEITVPNDSKRGDNIDVRVEFSDTNGNSLVDNFNISVI